MRKNITFIPNWLIDSEDITGLDKVKLYEILCQLQKKYTIEDSEFIINLVVDKLCNNK